jgi:hypothetical protein
MLRDTENKKTPVRAVGITAEIRNGRLLDMSEKISGWDTPLLSEWTNKAVEPKSHLFLDTPFNA